MSISKTRQKLVDVARQLFAKNGIANTTMNDIAVASGKGRRTLYTYFNRKEDVYSAVIESELERLSDKLDEVAAMKMRPQDKIIELIYTHLSMIRETVVRNGNLRAEFFRNIWMVEKVRKKFDEDEISIFRKVYADGKADGEFDIDDIDLVADITHYCIKGLEVPFIYGRLGHGMTEEASKPLVAKVVYGALGKRIHNFFNAFSRLYRFCHLFPPVYAFISTILYLLFDIFSTKISNKTFLFIYLNRQVILIHQLVKHLIFLMLVSLLDFSFAGFYDLGT